MTAIAILACAMVGFAQAEPVQPAAEIEPLSLAFEDDEDEEEASSKKKKKSSAKDKKSKKENKKKNDFFITYNVYSNGNNSCNQNECVTSSKGFTSDYHSANIELVLEKNGI